MPANVSGVSLCPDALECAVVPVVEDLDDLGVRLEHGQELVVLVQSHSVDRLSHVVELEKLQRDLLHGGTRKRKEKKKKTH